MEVAARDGRGAGRNLCKYKTVFTFCVLSFNLKLFALERRSFIARICSVFREGFGEQGFDFPETFSPTPECAADNKCLFIVEGAAAVSEFEQKKETFDCVFLSRS